MVGGLKKMVETRTEMNEAEQAKKDDWIIEELKNVSYDKEFEKLPSPPFEDKKIVELHINFVVPFQKYEDKERNKVKAIIPCMVKQKDDSLLKCNWWLNIKNPVYKNIMRIGKNVVVRDDVVVKVMQLGKCEKTKYEIISG